MKRSKLLIGATILATSIILTGCQSKEEKFKDSNSPFKLVKECGRLSTDGSGFNIYEVQDKNTGVHYYLLDGYESVAITPIINPNTTNSVKNTDKELEDINNKIKVLEKQKQEIENNKEEK